MARSLSIIWHEEADQLEALYKSEKEPQRRTRLACALVSALRPYRPIGGPSGRHPCPDDPTVAGLVSAGRVSPSFSASPWGAWGPSRPPECGGGKPVENLGRSRPDRQHLGWGRVGASPVWRRLYLLGYAQDFCPFRIKKESPPPLCPPGVGGRPRRLEKRGLTTHLQARGCPDGKQLFWGDVKCAWA